MVFPNYFAIARASGFAVEKGDLTGNYDDFDTRAEGGGVGWCGVILNGFGIEDGDIGDVIGFEFATIGEAKCAGGERGHFSDGFNEGDGFAFSNVATEDSRE